jgi:hypothetical protein
MTAMPIAQVYTVVIPIPMCVNVTFWGAVVLMIVAVIGWRNWRQNHR